MSDPVLVTGGLGCIGAWVCRALLADGDQPVVFDLGTDTRRLDGIMSRSETSSIRIVNGNLTDLDSVRRAAEIADIRRIIHLAALQVPFVRANPSIGAAVNVVGTVNVFETAKALSVDRVVYASSVAVFGPPHDYESKVLPHDAHPNPADLYGAFKVCNELSAKVYWARDGVCSVGLRPHTVYGPGRDEGITSDPTKAILAAAEGRPFEIGYGGHGGFSFVEDVARIFVQASKVRFEGAESFGIEGCVASVEEFIGAIKTVLGNGIEITYRPATLPIAFGMDGTALCRLLGSVPNRSLEEGIRATVEHHRRSTARIG